MDPPCPLFCRQAISPFLLAKDTTIVKAVNERFGLGDRAYWQYVAERKYKAYMAKLERGQTTINEQQPQQQHAQLRQGGGGGGSAADVPLAQVVPY